MHQHDFGLESVEHFVHPVQDPRGNAGQCLALGNHVQVEIGDDVEQPQHLVQHMPVLTRHADSQLEIAGSLDAVDQRRHFDGFRPGPKYGEDFSAHVGSLPSYRFIGPQRR